MIDYEQELKSIISKEKWLMNLLILARGLVLPDQYIAAGAIRNLVWDVLHGFDKRTPLNDIDLVYFDSSDISPEKDLNVYEYISVLEPGVNWNIFNQARSHIKNKSRNQVYSTIEGISYWSETPTCVGARLENDDSLTICAPHGLTDLMELRVRPIPKPYQNLDLYKKRIEEKKWDEIWPRLIIQRVN
jgi:hypothetical protein